MVQSALKLNAMNLPLIRTFISNSISTALYEYGMQPSSHRGVKDTNELTLVNLLAVAPQSITVDLGQMLVGDDIKKGECHGFSDGGCKRRTDLVNRQTRWRWVS